MISYFQSIRGLFILATLLLALQHLPLLAANWIPFGDGLYRYEVFYWFYSDFLYVGELPRWMPYGTYGMPAAYYQWSALTPLNYLVGFLGKLANTTDTRLLFNMATFLESWTYILGMLLLCERLFSSAAARLLVVLGAVFSLTWWGQPYLNLQVYYALPLVFYFLLRWREEGWMGFLWLAGMVEILSLLGNFPYAAILHFWIGFFFLLPSLQRPWPVWHGKGQALWLFLLLLLAAAFLTMALASLDGMVNLTPGRQEIGQRVSLQEFLGYARLPAADLLFNQLTGGLPHWEQDNYVGLAPLLLFPFALWRVSSPWLRGLGLVILFLLSLSLGHGLPQLAYYLPGMDHVRHITYLMTTAKMMILLASGFAIQYLAHGTGEKSSRWFALFILVLLAVELWPLTWTPQQPQPMEAWTVAAGRLLVYGVLLTLGWWWRNKFPWYGMLVAAFLLDVASYQLLALRDLPRANPPYPNAFFQAAPLPFLPQRSPYSGKVIPTPMGRSPELVRLLAARGDFAYNLPVVYTFGHHDPCYPQTRLELFPQVVVTMLESRGGQPRIPFTQRYALGEEVHRWQRQGRLFVFNRPILPPGQEIGVGGFHLLPAKDAPFWRALGCGDYKLRVVGGMQTAQNEQEAVEKLAALADPGKELVLLGEDDPTSLENTDPWNLQINGFSSNRLSLTVTLKGEQGQWLYYADGWHPHWQAWVDGTPVVVRRAQVGFKAIAIPPGEHQVVWYFSGGLAGLAMDFLAIVALLATLAAGGMTMVYFTGYTRRWESPPLAREPR